MVRGGHMSRGNHNSRRGGGNYRGGHGSYRSHQDSSRGSNRFNKYESYDSNRNSSNHQSNSSNRYGYKRTHSPERRNYSRGSRDESIDRKRNRYEGTRRSQEYGRGPDYSNGNRHERNSGPSNARYDRSFGSSSRRSDLNHRSSRDHHGSVDRSRDRMGPPSRPIRGRNQRNSLNSRINRPMTSSRGIRKPMRISSRRSDIRRRIISNRITDLERREKIAKLRSSIRDNESNNSSRGNNKDKDANVSDGSEQKETAKVEETEKGDQDPIIKTEDEDIKQEDSEAKSNADIEKAESVGSNASGAGDEKASGDKRDKDVNETVSDQGGNYKRPKHIKLKCVHCRKFCVTFKEYSVHLYSRKHKMYIKRIAIRQKNQLAKMRMDQRNAQKDLEDSIKGIENKSTQFCPLCRLNYRQSKEDHQNSSSHKRMKRFLMPYCNICRLTFNSPMVYEVHRCSLDHIKRKARLDSIGADEPVSDVEEKEVDFDQFMTVDSVGDVDAEINENDLYGKGDDAEKQSINVGTDFIKKMEAFYCELCRHYFSINDDEEKYLKVHCSSRSHLRNYLRYKENQNLRQAAEKMQMKSNSENVVKTDNSKVETEVKIKSEENNGDDEVNDKTGNDKTNVTAMCDTFSAFFDNIQELNAEDEDDDSTANTERYDRFRNSDGLTDKSESQNGKENGQLEVNSN